MKKLEIPRNTKTRHRYRVDWQIRTTARSGNAVKTAVLVRGGGCELRAGRSRCNSTELSVAAGAIDRWLSPRRRGRHLLTPYGAMAVGPAWPAIRHREPAGCREQYRHRGGREGAAGRLHAPPCQHYERD